MNTKTNNKKKQKNTVITNKPNEIKWNEKNVQLIQSRQKRVKMRLKNS